MFTKSPKLTSFKEYRMSGLNYLIISIGGRYRDRTCDLDIHQTTLLIN